MKATILTILILSLFFAVAGFAQAKTDTIIEYPKIEGAIQPGEATENELPEFIKYIFMFSLGAVGVLGLLMIIIGAFSYLTAVGNPTKAAEAKDKIFAALLGILLLLGSYLLLNIINPDLVKWGVGTGTENGTGNGNGNGNGNGEEKTDPFKGFSCYSCCGSDINPECNAKKREEGGQGNKLWCKDYMTLSGAEAACVTSSLEACFVSETQINHSIAVYEEICNE